MTPAPCCPNSTPTSWLMRLAQEGTPSSGVGPPWRWRGRGSRSSGDSKLDHHAGLECFSPDPCPQTPEKSPLQGERPHLERTGAGESREVGRHQGRRRPRGPPCPGLPINSAFALSYFELGFCFLFSEVPYLELALDTS